MDRMLLVLERSPEQKTELQRLLDAQQDPASPEYHNWLTPEQFGERFGAAEADIQTITLWLASQGFQVSPASAGKTIIEFSGTAGQVQRAFHTEIHKFVVNGEEHWANASDPKIPIALAPVVAGVATLHNFAKKAQLAGSPQIFNAQLREGQQPQLTSGSVHALAPGDFATIYNLNPLYARSEDGNTRSIAVVGRTNINVQDVNQFRSSFGLQPSTPTVVLTGANPGNLGGGEEAEAVLDVTWAGAIARGAAISLVVSKSTNTTDGVDLSESYIVNRNLADVMTESFGSCEANYTQAQAIFYSSLAEQAAAEGITYVVASGDSGSAGCNEGSDNTSNGALSVNMLASNPYVVAVGGTQFNENGNATQYWSSTNGSNATSALSYIPEVVWNESCSIPTGSNPCAGGTAPGLWAGGGGASAFYSKPTWQAGIPGIPNDGKRDVPDVSLSAAGHDPYLVCLRGSCTPNSRGQISLYGYAGTSAAAPSFAGIVAILARSVNGRLGAINTSLYALAQTQSWIQCDGSSTTAPLASTCIFNDVTAGNNSVPGVNDGSYPAGPGYDLATGLGSINITNLVDAISGGGGVPVLDVSSTAVDFGTVPLGSTQTRQITLTNTGSASVTIRFSPSINVSGQLSQSLTCGSIVVPGASCTLELTFRPTVSGAVHDSFLYLVNTRLPFLQIAVSGVGSAASTASVSVSPLDFGDQKVVTRSSSQAVTITNSTTQTIPTAGFTISGSKNDFALANTCGNALRSAATCTVYVSFTPQLVGNRSASLVIPVDAAGDYQSISLTGNGTLEGTFEIASSTTGKVLEVAGGSPNSGALIQQGALNGFQQQHWQFIPAGEGYFEIRNPLTGKALDVTGGSTLNGALVQQYDYLGGANQQWQLIPVDDVHYKIVNRGSGKVLDLPGGSSADGMPIQQWDYVGNQQQLWVLVPTQSYNILNNFSSQVIDVQAGTTADGARVQQWYWTGVKQQHWQFMPVGNGYYAILNRITGKVLDVTGASSANGAVIQQFAYLGGQNQQWQVVPVDDTNYKIVNRLSGKVLDNPSGSLVNGTFIQQWDYAGGANQQWQVRPVTYYTIINKQSGLALDVTGGLTGDGIPIQQWQSIGNEQQQWLLVGAGNGYQAVINGLTGKALELTGTSNDDATPVQQSSYGGSDGQQWRFISVAGGYYEILNKRSGRSLDVTGGSLSNGGSVQQWDYLNGGNQQWSLVPVTN